MEKENVKIKKNNGRWFANHQEIKTREDLQDLLDSFSVKGNIKGMLSKLGEMTNLAVKIRKDIKSFEKGEEIDKEKLGKNIDKLRLLKHELGMIKFGKFQEILIGKVNDYAKKPELNETEKER